MEAALKGSGEIGFTIVSITLSLIAVFIPLFLMGGYVGKLFQEFAITVSVSLVLSLVISLTLTPMMCARLLKHGIGQHGWLYRLFERGFDGLLGAYERGLKVALRHRFITLMVMFGTIALTGYLYRDHPQGFLPPAGYRHDPRHLRRRRRTSRSRPWPSGSRLCSMSCSRTRRSPRSARQVGAGGGDRHAEPGAHVHCVEAIRPARRQR